MSTVLTPTLGLVEKAWADHIVRESRRGPSSAREYLYASQRRKCLRRSVLESTQPEMLPPFDADALARMRRGVDRERDIGIDLERVGRLCEPSFAVVSQQESIRITDRKGRLIISGKIDGQLRFTGGERWPFETKAWSPLLTDRVHAFSDLYYSPWLWSGAHQLLSYLYAKNQPKGLLILDRPGLPRLIEVNLEENIQQMEDFLADATICVDHIQAKTLPGFIDDSAECKRCPFFGSACQPPSFTEGAQVLVDEELIQMLERWHELQGQGEEWSDLDSALKKRLHGTDMAIAGGFLIEGSWTRDTKYDLTNEVKAQIKEIKKPFARKVEKGKYSLGITKI